jgi:hypothetical protein
MKRLQWRITTLDVHNNIIIVKLMFHYKELKYHILIFKWLRAQVLVHLLVTQYLKSAFHYEAFIKIKKIVVNILLENF